MALKEEYSLQNRRQKYEEGKKIKDFLKNDHATLEKIKQQKLQQMKDLGIPEKFHADLAKMKV